MITIDVEVTKRSLKIQLDTMKQLWLEKALLRNLILDSRLMSEQDLAVAIIRAKDDPANIQQVNQAWAEAEDLLAEIGIGDWLAQFEKLYPKSD